MRTRLVVADLVALSAAFLVVTLPRERSGLVHPAQVAATLFATLAAWLLVAPLLGLFDEPRRLADLSVSDELARVLEAVVCVGWVPLGASYALGTPLPLASLCAFGACAWLLVLGLRLVARSFGAARDEHVQRAAIVGAGNVGQLVARKIVQHPDAGIALVGFVDAHPRERRTEVEGVPVIGTPSELRRLVDEHRIDRLIVAFSSEPPEYLVHLLRALEDAGVRVDVVPRLFELVGPAARVGTMEGLPFVELGRPQSSAAARAGKRAIDIVGAALGLLVLAPLFAFIAWRIAREGDGPVLFRQVRLGYGMREFTTYKFRTMRTNVSDLEHRAFIQATATAGAAPAENGLFKLERTDDVTPTGRWLRRTSLDELPQLWNVLRGDMSLVGPRPCLAYELQHFARHHFDRFRVRPGLTGYWQVTARAHASFGEALDLDVAYVRDWSLALDLRLLAATPAQLFNVGATR
ncbi:MAG TPA: sugar transferase [Gaiellaceae bacterium]|nr:sugar transferase [Gaiellaceae bacterium]